MGTRALIYTRVSQDRAGGRSPAEQEAEARAHCEREGWEVAEVVTDSVGASRHSKGHRDGWGRARRLVGAGDVDVLVTWEASRAQRDLSAYSELRDLCAAHGVRWAYSGRVHDLTTSDGRFRTGLDALLAEREADEIAERVQRAMRANASRGRPHGRRLFGYRRVYDDSTGALIGQEPHPDEAPTVRRIFAEYLAGASARAIARDLNAEGLTTGTGASWNETAIRRVLANASYAARRVHRGEIVGDGDWPPLVDAGTFDRAQQRLAARRGTRQTPTARLLTGVARCGVCGSRLHVGHDRRQRKLYACTAPGFHVARDEAKLDAYVTAVVLERLSRPDVAEALEGQGNPEADEARRRAEELRLRLDDAVSEFTAGRLSAATLARIEGELGEQITAADREARQALVPLSIDLPEPDGVDHWWDELPREMRREVVAALIAGVIVHPTGKGRRTFDPAAVEIEWRRM